MFWFQERKESEVLPVEVSHRSWETRIDGGMDLDFRRQPHAVQFDVDFWPVEHPMEPQDEDRPVKCPMSAASSITVRHHVLFKTIFRIFFKQDIKKG